MMRILNYIVKRVIKLTEIHLFLMTLSICNLCVGSVQSIPLMRSLASVLTLDHSGSGKSYCPSLIRFFIPGDMAKP